MAFKDHFSQSASGYAAYRPTYPSALVDYLASISPATHCALDCGCGTGQLSVLLAARFEKVAATDASAQQIQHAQPHPRVTYETAPAESSGLPASSVDLITVAQAAHWLDLPQFYAEARRVGRPSAALALVTYGVIEMEGAVNAIVQHFYHDVVGPYWPPERRHVEEGYRNLPFPFEEIQAPPLAIEANWTCAALAGYVDTWSAVRALEKAAGRAPLETFFEDLSKAWGGETLQRTVRFPLSLRVGKL